MIVGLSLILVFGDPSSNDDVSTEDLCFGNFYWHWFDGTIDMLRFLPVLTTVRGCPIGSRKGE